MTTKTMDPVLRAHCEHRHALRPEPLFLSTQDDLVAWHERDHTVIKSHLLSEVVDPRAAAYVPGARVSLRRGHRLRPSIGLSHQRLLVHGLGLVLIVRLDA